MGSKTNERGLAPVWDIFQGGPATARYYHDTRQPATSHRYKDDYSTNDNIATTTHHYKDDYRGTGKPVAKVDDYRGIGKAEADQLRLMNKMLDMEIHQKLPGNDSAVSVGSSDDEHEREIARREKKKKRMQAKEAERAQKESRHKNAKSGERELVHLERHLSMKKTLRRKMMRDLQQAFVENPNEFMQDPNSIPKNERTNIDVRNWHMNQTAASEPSFLDMLKDEKRQEHDSGNSSPTHEAESRVPIREPETSRQYQTSAEDEQQSGKPKRSFWKFITSRSKNKR